MWLVAAFTGEERSFGAGGYIRSNPVRAGEAEARLGLVPAQQSRRDGSGGGSCQGEGPGERRTDAQGRGASGEPRL